MAIRKNAREILDSINYLWKSGEISLFEQKEFTKDFQVALKTDDSTELARKIRHRAEFMKNKEFQRLIQLLED